MKLNFAVLFVAVTSVMGHGGSYGGRNSCTCEPTGVDNEVLCDAARCANKLAWQTWNDNGRPDDGTKPESRRGDGGGLRSGDGGRGRWRYGGRGRDDDCTCDETDAGDKVLCAVERCAAKVAWQVWNDNGRPDDGTKPERRERIRGGNRDRGDDCTCDLTSAEGKDLCSTDRCALKARYASIGAEWKAWVDGGKEGPKPSRRDHD